MSYVIKGPCGGNQYLTEVPDQPVPQWFWRDKAKRFPTKQDALVWLDMVQHKFTDAGSYCGRIVKLVPRMRPIPMILHCPDCRARHIDEGEFATKRHHTHSCQSCGLTWRPAVGPTCGVRFLPGFKNEDSHAPR